MDHRSNSKLKLMDFNIANRGRLYETAASLALNLPYSESNLIFRVNYYFNLWLCHEITLP